MNTLRKGLSIAVSALIGTVAVILVIVVLMDGSVMKVVSNPAFWVAEVSTAVLAPFAVLTRPGNDATDGSRGRPRPPAWRIVAIQTAWAIAAALLIGVLIGIAVDTPVLPLLRSTAFLIPAGIAVAVAAAEAWPANQSKNR